MITHQTPYMLIRLSFTPDSSSLALLLLEVTLSPSSKDMSGTRDMEGFSTCHQLGWSQLCPVVGLLWS
ncbi:hypothetical protein AV530_010965 [Patagioenas fasciata monilis]|uniref:Uncharacterized protein n=1 Tax=Patagioenas fasciata monilis TaxID=372326 RepID=A0A1V4K8C6_PATFA|nr:hypothetical protein AV530_010965 [Patagioenas fasciata monilis]